MLPGKADVNTQPAPSHNVSSLFKLISAGHEPSFTTLYQQYYGLVFSTALQYCKMKTVAEDIAQHVFLVVWKKRATLMSIEKGESWLWTVARNEATSILRKEVYRRAYINYIKERFEEQHESPLGQLLEKQKRERIEEIINALPPRQRQVYRLSRGEGMSYAAIAKTLKISPETVKDYMSGALKNMRIMLLQYKGEILISLT